MLEVFGDQVYGRSFDGQVVFDIGMSNADSAIFFAINGAKKVVGLEPHVVSFQLAERNIKANNLQERIIPLNCALSATNGVKRFATSTKEPNISTLSPNSQKEAEYDQSICVEAVSLEEIMRRQGIEKVDLLKMDCEGCEYDVLMNLKREELAKIRSMVVEYHNGGERLATMLGRNGYLVSYVKGVQQGLLRAKQRY